MNCELCKNNPHPAPWDFSWSCPCKCHDERGCNFDSR